MLKRVLLAGLAIAALVSPAGAFDFLYTGRTPATLARGTLDVGLSVLYVTSDDTYNEDGTTVPSGADWTATWIPVEFSYGITDLLTGGLTGGYGSLSLDGVPSVSDPEQRSDAKRDYEGAGIGDLWVWMKYGVREDPLVAVRGAVKIPAGAGPVDRAHAVADTGFFLDDGGHLALGDGQTDIDGAVLLGFPMQTGVFELSLGYRYRMGQTVNKDDNSYDYEPGNEFHFDLGYRYDLNDAMDLRLGLSGFYGSDDSAETDYSGPDHSQESLEECLEGSSRSAVWIDTSFAYVMKNGILLGFDVHHPLMGQNVPAEWGIAFRLGLAV
ncbi:MAG: transporter [Candidatus Eisenbacteria bacterium]|nr:transporter [Candidatus Eisenbacteria bacterium]